MKGERRFYVALKMQTNGVGFQCDNVCNVCSPEKAAVADNGMPEGVVALAQGAVLPVADAPTDWRSEVEVLKSVAEGNAMLRGEKRVGGKDRAQPWEKSRLVVRLHAEGVEGTNLLRLAPRSPSCSQPSPGPMHPPPIHAEEFSAPAGDSIWIPELPSLQVWVPDVVTCTPRLDQQAGGWLAQESVSLSDSGKGGGSPTNSMQSGSTSSILSGSNTARGAGVHPGDSPALHAYPRIFPRTNSPRPQDPAVDSRNVRAPMGLREMRRDSGIPRGPSSLGPRLGRGGTPTRSVLTDQQRRRLGIDVYTRDEEEGLLL